MILFTYLSFTLTSLSWSHSLELQCLSQSVCWIQWHLSQFSQWPLFKIRKRFFQMWRRAIAMKSSLIFSLHACCLTCWVSSISWFFISKILFIINSAFLIHKQLSGETCSCCNATDWAACGDQHYSWKRYSLPTAVSNIFQDVLSWCFL